MYSPSGKWIILDPDNVMLDASPTISPAVQFCKGRLVWDVFPTAQALMEPLYEKARCAGVYTESVVWESIIVRLDCLVMPDNNLLVGVQSIPLNRDEGCHDYAKFRCNLCDDTFEDVLPPVVDLHWPSCCDTPSFLLEVV